VTFVRGEKSRGENFEGLLRIIEQVNPGNIEDLFPVLEG
jgi:hypothetical protein